MLIELIGILVIKREKLRNTIFSSLIQKGLYDKDNPMIVYILISDPSIWMNLVSRADTFRDKGDNPYVFREKSIFFKQ